jgi:hypothetical protein
LGPGTSFIVGQISAVSMCWCRVRTEDSIDRIDQM